MTPNGEPPSLTHISLGKQLGERNSPSVYSAAGQVAQFWIGRASTIEAQALVPVPNPVETALPNGPALIAVLASIPGYVDAFEQAFAGQEGPPSVENFGQAIGAFERTLVTPAPRDILQLPASGPTTPSPDPH